MTEDKEAENTQSKGDWSDEFVHHWKYYLVPARASPSDLEFIKKKILEKINKYDGDKSKVRLLIFGSTPEYRSLCGELGISCYCFDFKRYNYDYLTDEVKNKPEETFVEGNWLDILPNDLEGKDFDIILADNVLNIVIKEFHSKLLKNVIKMLKPDGLFMPRTYIREKDKKWTGELAIEEYRKGGSKKPFYTWCMREIYFSAYDYEKDYFILKDSWIIVKNLHDKGLITDEEFEECKKVSLENRELKFHAPIIEDFEEELKELFEIKETFFGTELYIKDMLPLYVLVKKVN